MTDTGCFVVIENHPNLDIIVTGPGATTTTTPQPTTTTTSTTTTTTTTTSTTTTTTTTSTTTTYSPAFSDLYVVNIIDESDPGYSASLSGLSFGNLWSIDSAYLSGVLQSNNFNSNFIGVFDIGNRPKQVGQQIWPSGAIVSNNITQSPCYLPIPRNNIVSTPRNFDTNTMSDFIVSSGIANANGFNWGSFASIKSAKPDGLFIFVIDDSGSMTYDMIRDAMYDVYSQIVAAGLRCIVLSLCSSERWLQWSGYVIENLDYILSEFAIQSPPTNGYNLPLLTANFCDGCETVNFTSLIPDSDPALYRAKVKMTLQGQQGTQDIIYTENSTWWDIVPEFSEGTTIPTQIFGNFGYHIGKYGEYNAEQQVNTQYIQVTMYCRQGILTLDVYSQCNALQAGTSNQIYEWRNIELNVNSDGLPVGYVSLSTPTDLINNDLINEINSSYYNTVSYYVSPKNINESPDPDFYLPPCEPIVPTILFEILPYETETENPCVQFNVTTTTTAAP